MCLFVPNRNSAVFGRFWSGIVLKIQDGDSLWLVFRSSMPSRHRPRACAVPAPALTARLRATTLYRQPLASRAAHRARHPASKHWAGPPPRCGASRRARALRRGRPRSPGTTTCLHRLLRCLASSLLPAPCAASLRPALAVPLRSLRVAQCAPIAVALTDQNKPVRLTLIRRTPSTSEVRSRFESHMSHGLCNEPLLTYCIVLRLYIHYQKSPY